MAPWPTQNPTYVQWLGQQAGALWDIPNSLDKVRAQYFMILHFDFSQKAEKWLYICGLSNNIYVWIKYLWHGFSLHCTTQIWIVWSDALFQRMCHSLGAVHFLWVEDKTAASFPAKSYPLLSSQCLNKRRSHYLSSMLKCLIMTFCAPIYVLTILLKFYRWSICRSETKKLSLLYCSLCYIVPDLHHCIHIAWYAYPQHKSLSGTHSLLYVIDMHQTGTFLDFSGFCAKALFRIPMCVWSLIIVIMWKIVWHAYLLHQSGRVSFFFAEWQKWHACCTYPVYLHNK